MPFVDSMSLERALTRLELVDHETLVDCRKELGKRPSPENLLSCLCQRNALTTYQAGRLRKGETDGLRLGPHKLLYRNASGSFARVYRAASVEDGRIIGIKLLRQRWASDPRIVSLFRREGELGKRLKHRNIVPIYDVVTEGNQHYLTMEFVEGGNFRDFLRIRGKFSPSEATRYVIDMAEGLNYACSQRITHRDLKLTNVLLSSQGVAKLVDFGLAGNEGAMLQFDEEVDRALEYAALEKGSDAPDNDPRSDLYFLGAIYHELLTGRPPYPSARDRQERKRFGRYRDVKPLRAIDPNIPSGVEAVVRRLMNVNPNERYQNAAEVLTDLKALLPELSATDAAALSSFNTAGYIEDDPLLASEDTATSLMGGDTSGEDSGSFRDRDLKPSLPTILCVEDRPKHQDALRDYFTRHGYRVLILTDAQRALLRMASDPPEALLLIGDVLGEQLPKIVNEALAGARRYGTAVIVALGKKEIAGLTRLEREPRVTILPQPVTLRDIRHAVGEVRHRNASTG